MKVLFIIFLIIACLGGIYSYYKNHTLSDADTEALSQLGERADSSKATVDCSAFGQTPDLSTVNNDLRGEAQDIIESGHYLTNDKGALPDDFPDLAENSSLCGSIKSINTTYYLTTLKDKDLFQSLRAKLLRYGCTVGEPKVTVGNQGLYYMSFICSGISGLVSNDPIRSAYSIVYPAR